MVRIPLPHRLKSYGANSASNSRSTSPSPGVKIGTAVEGSGEPAKANGLLLKVVVLKVGPHRQEGNNYHITTRRLIADANRLGISRRRTRAVHLTQ
jgi:hypothetical protein